MYAPLPCNDDAQQRGAPAASGGGAGAWCLQAVTPSPRTVGYAVAVLGLTAGLALTYDSCVGCVVAIALVALLLIQLPFMPIVLIVAMGLLLVHAVDYQSATFKVEIPIADVVYVPTMDDLRKYVHMTPHAAAAINNEAARP